MSNVMLDATYSFFDVKNIEESRLPSKTGAVRFLAVSALVVSIFASALIPAVICTGVIATTTAAIMLKNRRVEQLVLNENEVVNGFKDDINNYTTEKTCALLTVCFSCLIGEKGKILEKVNRSRGVKLSFPKLLIQWISFPTNTKKHFLREIQRYAKLSDNELKQETSRGGMTISLTEDQEKIKELSVISILSIIKHLYTQLGKKDKALEIAKLIQKVQSETENSIDQTEK